MRRRPEPHQPIVVAETVALPDDPPRMAQVVFGQTAVGVVVHQVLVPVDHIPGPQQVAHPLEAAGRFAAERNPAVERQPRTYLRRNRCVETQVAKPFDTIFQRIDRMPAAQPVDDHHAVPVDLRIARVGCPPRLLGIGVEGERGQVTIIVGHGRAGVVPP